MPDGATKICIYPGWTRLAGWENIRASWQPPCARKPDRLNGQIGDEARALDR